MTKRMEIINLAKDYIQSRTNVRPELAVILGSGLGALAEEVQVDVIIPYNEIPGFPESTVAGHAGQLVLGKLAGKNVAVMQGRVHYYEGQPMAEIKIPIRTLHALGARSLLVTNAAGGLNPNYEPGDVMLIVDHINLMGSNPLIGPNEDDIGPRFPDMTYAYAPDLRALAITIAKKKGIAIQQGVYAAVSGPSFETPAERRYLRIIGADAIGMSTVPEVITANHAGMRIIGFSAITNKATGDADQQPDSHEEVLAMALIAGEKLIHLVRYVIEAMPTVGTLAPDQLAALIAENPSQIANIIDHTLLKPDAISSQIEQLCLESLEYSFASVCINPIHVKQAATILKDANVKVGTVIGFPLGAIAVDDKVRETIQSIEDGASEIDMVINIGALKEKNDSLVELEIASVVRAAHSRGVLCKVIIEAGLLNHDEKVRACQLAKKAGADFVKTSTGFMGSGATAEDVRLMRQTVGSDMGVKASGGVRTLASAQEMIKSGANRIGTSASVAMMKETK
jgi:purine-nucleoside phosphorylase